jgi:hypothetical protein
MNKWMRASKAIDGMLCDILAAIASADYEAAAASAKLGVAPRPARGGAPLSPANSPCGGAFFRARRLWL